MLKIFNCLKDVRSRFKSCHVNFFLLLSVLWLWLMVPGVVSAQEVVDIPDPGLRAAIAEALGKAPGDAITPAEMETLVTLRATNRDITDLRGIEFAINLTGLSLWRNNISDISPVANLTNLTELYLSNNNISDISPVANLINLIGLSLWGNTISDISPVANLINLTLLWLTNNTISDISPVTNLINLTDLRLHNNTISDISPVTNLINLTDLRLHNNTISDISPVANLINLTLLWLTNNTISDISPVANLTNLTRLYLYNNNISDISPVANLTNLTLLSLNNNNISDISPVANLTNLTLLWLWGNNIFDIVPLIALTNLTHLSLQNNNISDVETLERLMAQGTVVYFRGNPAFETPGPKIEDGWVWLIVPATNVRDGFDAAASGRDFLSEASGGAVTETNVAVNGARAGTRVGDSVWTAAPLAATDPDNLNALVRDHNLGTDIAYPVAYDVVPIQSETPQEIGDSVWTSAPLDPTDPDNFNVLVQDHHLETHITYPVAYGVVSIQSETQQQTRVYIGAGPVKVYLNGTLVHRNTHHRSVSNYETAVPVLLNAGDNLLFIAAYRQSASSRWGAFFGFQDGTGYTIGAPSAGNLDVNGDGQVNVIDLAIVALFYGTQVPVGISLPADVNADGIVNILDLTAVAQGIDAAGNAGTLSADDVAAVLEAIAGIEAIPEAPASHALRSGIAYRNVAAAFTDVKHLATDDARLGKWMPLLKELLQRLAEMREIPDTTALLPNYPNPFNPETWIPYRLATDTAVVLTIYDVRGSVVRALTLGHQAAGIYESRARAAYWDGRNALGEPVASGLYFYTLTAGEFTATRKLLIVK